MLTKGDLEYVARILEHYKYQNKIEDYELEMAVDYLRALIEEEFTNVQEQL